VQIRCFPPSPENIPAIVDLDQRSLGGLWSAQTYLRELESPNSCLRILGKPLENIEDPGKEPSKDSIDSMATVPGTAGARAMESGTTEPMVIIGVGCYWEIVDEAHITVLAVDPCYHRRGLGRWLLINLLEEACRRGLQRATLEVRASNRRAILLYESFRFEPLGTRKRYYPDGEDALILWQNSLKTVDFRAELTRKRTWAINRLNAQGWQVKDPKLAVNRTGCWNFDGSKNPRPDI
jgi:ribosomal-protein-alanine N-acetyltransferase